MRRARPDPQLSRISRLSAAGEVLPLGRYSVEPSRHLALVLRDLVRPAGRHFFQGSLRLSFLGDTGTLQAWVVVRRGRQAIEISCQAPSEVAGSELTAFWDSSGLPGRPAVYLLNAGNRNVRYNMASGGQPGSVLVSTTIAPGERHRITPPTAETRGWVRVRHDGDPGSLIATAMVEGPKHLSGAGLVHGTVEVATEFEVVRVPLDRGQADGSAQAVVTLFNASTELNRATVTVVSAVTGQTLDEVTRSLKPREVLSLRLSPPRLAHSLDRPTVEEARVRVSAQAPGLLVAGRSVLAAGETIDHSFFPAGDAHAAGSYPVLPLEEFDVDLTLANLDPEDSQVVAQFFWDGGAYAFGPVTIPGGTSYRLSVADVVQRADPDVLGRTLPGQLPGGFLKWKVMSGSRRLLGRTEARYRDSSDAFGFNCFGCCYEVPFGTIVPDFVDFEPGQSPLFEASMGTIRAVEQWGLTRSYPAR